MSDEHVSAYPLAWPIGRKRTIPHLRKRAAFNVGGNSLTIGRAVQRLLCEVEKFTRPNQTYVINPKTVIVSCNVPTKGDGMPYTNQRQPDDPGVAVYFILRSNRHCVSCDRWLTVADNIGAIAKYLEATRGIERWGTSDVEALFAGFKALPPGSGEPSASAIVTPQAMTLDAAAEFIGNEAFRAHDVRRMLINVDTYRDVFRTAVKRLHPDANGGRTLPEWTTLQAAADVLKRHHKL